MYYRTLRLTAAALLLLSGNFAASALAGGKDKTPLEGTWKGEGNGMEMRMTFTGSKWSLKLNKCGQEINVAGTFKIDAKQKPKTMDLQVTEASEPLEKFKDKTAKAIYELEGDKLKWVANQPGNEERPKMFPNQAGESDGHLYIIFQREKK